MKAANMRVFGQMLKTSLMLFSQAKVKTAKFIAMIQNIHHCETMMDIYPLNMIVFLLFIKLLWQNIRAANLQAQNWIYRHVASSETGKNQWKHFQPAWCAIRNGSIINRANYLIR